MKHIFMVNPAAGLGDGSETLIPPIREFLRTAEYDFEIHRTLNKQETGSYCRQRAASGEEIRFYACGGDGTINDVANGIYGFPNASLAVIPCGTGNDFVKNFSYTDNFLNIEAQANGHTEEVDLISMNGERFAVNQLNIGADCDIVVEADKMKRYPFINGHAAYFSGALKVMANIPKYKMSYERDGRNVEDTLLLCAIGNGVWCGGGFKSCPKAKLNDGLMDIGLVSPVPGPKIFKLMLQYKAGKHLESKECEPYVNYIQSDSFTLEPIDDFYVSIDGEVEQFQKTEFKVLHNAIKVVVPYGCEML